MGIVLTEQYRRFRRSLMQKLAEAAFILEGEMHRIVAIDTGDLNRSIMSGNVIDRGNLFSVDVGTEGIFYADYVELGVGAVYNYHRREGGNRPVVWVGNGQHFIERSLQAKYGEIMAKIREARIS